MYTMFEMINRICGDDQPLCEAVLNLYKPVANSQQSNAVSTRLWQRIEQEYANGTLGNILGNKNRMRPAGVPLSVGGASVIMVAGKCNDNNVVSYNPSVGPKVPERIVINIGPYISKYYATHEVNLTQSYNDIVYEILKENWADIKARLDHRMKSKANHMEFVDNSIDKLKEMYSTEA